MKLKETNPTSFRETRPRESKPRSKFVWVHKAKGNEVKICLSRRPSENRHIFILVLQAEGNKCYRDVGTARLRGAKSNKFLRNQAEGK